MPIVRIVVMTGAWDEERIEVCISCHSPLPGGSLKMNTKNKRATFTGNSLAVYEKTFTFFGEKDK